MSFNNVFGGGVLNPTDVSYRAVTLTANVTLVWPPLSTTATDYVARILGVTPSAGGFVITMPPANQVSTGENVLFTNDGAFTYIVHDSAGGVITSVTAGQQVMIYPTNNSTEAGVWESFIFGVGSSALSAASLQGYGVKAIGSTLNADHPISITSTPITVTTADRAKLFVWTGGVAALTLPVEATAVTGFFFEVRNQGSGILTITPQAGETIDTLSTIQLQPNDSCFIHAAAALTWYSVGRGRNTLFAFTQLVKSVTGGTDTLTQSEASNVIQRYTGVLTSNETVVVPAVAQIYYVTNATTGAFTFTMQSPSPGSVITIPSGDSVIIFCDGINVTQANNTLSTNVTNLVLDPGTATAPSLTFTGSPQSGLYAPAAGTVGVSINGTAALTFSGVGAVNIPNVNITGGTISGVSLPSAPVPDFLLYAQGVI